MKIISERRDFAPGECKRADLEDVVFSGGLVRRSGGKAELYCGVGDAEAHVRIIDDPFLKKENENDGSIVGNVHSGKCFCRLRQRAGRRRPSGGFLVGAQSGTV